MPSQRRPSGPGFLIALAVAVFIVGCTDQATPRAKQEVAKLTPEQEFVAELKKAEAGDAAAQHKIGVMYQRGEGVPMNQAKAFDWYQKAAAQGDTNAHAGLGRMYLHGIGVAKDATKSIEWLQKPAAQGDGGAQYDLGLNYAEGGKGVPKDMVKAFEWYQKAATQGDANAQNKLGNIFIGGEFFIKGLPKDPDKAFEWWQKAAKQGNGEAQANLGWAYTMGEGTPKNLVEALEWYRKAAMHGNAYALHKLGVAYVEGLGVPKDSAKAIEWFQKAAALGEILSQMRLGYMYGTGEGISRDLVLSYAWDNLASTHSYFGRDASKLRDETGRMMSSADLAEAQRLSSGWKYGQILVREGKPLVATPSAVGNPTKQGTGTAFLVSNTGQAITNHHVIDGCREAKAEGRDGVVKVVTSDTVNDLALLQIPGAVRHCK